MVSSGATTVSEYLALLEPVQGAEVNRVLEVVRAAIPKDLDEGMAHGMIGWSVPLSRYPDTYNGEPMLYAALAAQKRHISLYLMPVYIGGSIDEGVLRDRWAGRKRLDMGRSCVRFRSADDLDLPLIAEALGQFTVDSYIAAAEAGRARRS